MACHRFEDLIFATLEKSLSPQGQREMNEHLAICVSCRAFMEEQKGLDAMLTSALSPPILASGFKERLLLRAACMQEKKPSFFASFAWLDLLGYASLALTAGLIIHVFLVSMESGFTGRVFPTSFSAVSEPIRVGVNWAFGGASLFGGLWLGLKEQVRSWSAGGLF